MVFGFHCEVIHYFAKLAESFFSGGFGLSISTCFNLKTVTATSNLGDTTADLEVTNNLEITLHTKGRVSARQTFCFRVAGRVDAAHPYEFFLEVCVKVPSHIGLHNVNSSHSFVPAYS